MNENLELLEKMRIRDGHLNSLECLIGDIEIEYSDDDGELLINIYNDWHSCSSNAEKYIFKHLGIPRSYFIGNELFRPNILEYHRSRHDNESLNFIARDNLIIGITDGKSVSTSTYSVIEKLTSEFSDIMIDNIDSDDYEVDMSFIFKSLSNDTRKVGVKIVN